MMARVQDPITFHEDASGWGDFDVIHGTITKSLSPLHGHIFVDIYQGSMELLSE